MPCTAEPSSTSTSAGVRNTPSRLETAAAQTAAETLPRAMDVSAIADCTVDGSTQK